MKALFVGLGSIGQRHLRNLKDLKPDIDVMAVRRTRTVPVLDYSNNVVHGATLASHYGIDEYDSLDEALSKKPTVVFITNPSSMHIEVARKAIVAGAYIFIEKPISHSWEGINELLAMEQSIGAKRIVVGYQYRFHPAMKLIKSLLTEDRIGTLISARLINGEYMPGWHPYEDYKASYASRKSLGGGALLTQIHDFDYALWFFGLPKQLFAVGGHLSSLEIDVEDSVQILMSCDSGGKSLPVTIALDYLQSPATRSFSIVGELGTIECNLISSVITVSDRVKNTIKVHEFPNLERNDIFKDEMDNFLGFVEGNSTPCVDLKMASESLQMALAAHNSMANGKAVSLSGKF